MANWNKKELIIPPEFDAPEYQFIPPGVTKQFDNEEGHEKITKTKY